MNQRLGFVKKYSDSSLTIKLLYSLIYKHGLIVV